MDRIVMRGMEDDDVKIEESFVRLDLCTQSDLLSSSGHRRSIPPVTVSMA